MDQRIFDQLNMLERGARIETRRPNAVYDNSSAEYSAYDIPEESAYADGSGYGYLQDRQDDQIEFIHEPMVLDAFDQQLLRQSTYASRQGQANLGRARLSLPPGISQVAPSNHELDEPSFETHHELQRTQAFDVSRFTFDTFDTTQPAAFTSSPSHQHLPSSPAYNASQRRTPLVTHDQTHGLSFHGDVQPPTTQRTADGQDDAGMFSGQPKHTTQSRQAGVFQPSRMEEAFAQPAASRNRTAHEPPVVQGISLISTHALPDRFRAIFPYPLFNAVQSKSFEAIYKTNDNFVLAAPTGSGKTVVLELAICRLINGFANGSYKIVYQAPTKSLCSERQRDWQAKFGPLDLQCAELTGDTENAQLRNVQNASIIVTTPEKWDSVTRKWKDHQKLMQMVKLFLVDEVHILKEDRGATLEAVVSRMKSVGSDVRFIALSATVPNSQDIATWLGRNPMQPDVPAIRERFGEEFRPVRLQRHVCGYQSNSNDFAFEKTLNIKLSDVITKWSQRKPIMVFCFTRSACVETAKVLASWWTTKGPRDRFWSPPRNQLKIDDKDLKGVAFHHAGLSIQDRNAIEKGYVEGDVQVICCTSTLAVGVNLPCHMVIIKNTVTYQNNAARGCKEYSDLEIMQMLGRAGRPQFDDSAVAVIMTRLQHVRHYEKMISGQEVLESCLHRNLIDHLNAEIGLGTITGPSSAKKWLMGTFLFVRLKDNPEHYKLEGDAPGRNLEERLETICAKGITSLEENDLIMSSPKLRCTEYGDAMARYYIQFDTMKMFLSLATGAKISEILNAIAHAAEFKEIRFRAGEKSTYKDLNKNGSIKFPIQVNLDSTAHKVSLVMQSVLGAIELPTEDHKQRMEYNTAKGVIFQHVHRLVRCIVDCNLYDDDAVTTRNALMLARSLGAQVWDDSPLHMKQLEGIGLVSVRKLVNPGVRSVEELETTEAHRIESILSRNPPYGAQIHDKAKAFPKLRISLNMVGQPVVKKGESVGIKLKAEIGFINEKAPEVFQRKPVYVCLLAENSDGEKVHFARVSAKKLNNAEEVLFDARLTKPTQSLRAYVMCVDIAGTMRHANLKPDIPADVFPPPRAVDDTVQPQSSKANAAKVAARRIVGGKTVADNKGESDEFGDDDIDDAELALVAADDFVDIDEFEPKNALAAQSKKKKTPSNNQDRLDSTWEPQQLANGNWACNHPCKDKTACKHLCCREGLDKKPKPPKAKESKQAAEPSSERKQAQLNLPVSKKATKPTQTKSKKSREASNLDRLHNNVQTKTAHVPTQQCRKTTTQVALEFGRSRPRFLETTPEAIKEDKANYGREFGDSDDLLGIDQLLGDTTTTRMSSPKGIPGTYDSDDEMLELDHEPDHMEDTLPGYDGSDGDLGNFSFHADTMVDWDNDSHTFKSQPGNMFNANPGEIRSGSQDESRGEQLSAKHHNRLFVGDNSDSAMQDFDLRIQKPEHKRPFEHVNAEPDRFFDRPKKQRTTSRMPPEQLRQEVETFERALPMDEVFADAPDASAAAKEDTCAEGSMNSDELRGWFDAEFGKELFTYTGA